MSEAHKKAAKLRGEARTAEVDTKIRQAILTIQQEMAANDGIYPSNGGAISMNKVARRAKISETTLFSPKQKELGKFVKDWIESLKKKAIVGRKNVQRSHFERSKDWHKKYLSLQDAHITTELELQDAKVQLQEAHQSLADLKEKYSALLEQLHQRTDSKITPLKKIKH